MKEHEDMKMSNELKLQTEDGMSFIILEGPIDEGPGFPGFLKGDYLQGNDPSEPPLIVSKRTWTFVGGSTQYTLRVDFSSNLP